MADAAAAAVWGLVKDHPQLLRPESEELEIPAASLVAPLLDIINRSEVRCVFKDSHSHPHWNMYICQTASIVEGARRGHGQLICTGCHDHISALRFC